MYVQTNKVQTNKLINVHNIQYSFYLQHKRNNTIHVQSEQKVQCGFMDKRELDLINNHAAVDNG